MGPWIALAAAAVCLTLAGGSVAQRNPTARLRSDGMPVVNGAPTLLLGLYEYPETDTGLAEAVEAGFNLIYAPAKSEALDRIARHGAWAWVNTGYALDLSEDTDGRKAALQRMAASLGSHPSLLIWEGPDEGLWNCWYGVVHDLDKEWDEMDRLVAGRPDLKASADHVRDLYARALWARYQAARLEFWNAAGVACPVPEARMDTAGARGDRLGDGFTKGIDYLRNLDPHRLIWLNHAPRNAITDLRRHNRAVDMAGCDIYPIPSNLQTGHSDLPSVWPSSVGDYTRRMRQAAPGRACAMVLQGFGWRDLEAKPTEERIKLGFGRRPNLLQHRFMAWDAIVNGAHALLYWGTAHLKEPDSADTRRFRSELYSVIKEIRSLERFIVAPAPRGKISARAERGFGSIDGGGIIAWLRRSGDDYLLAIVNENQSGVAFKVTGLPEALNGRTLVRIGTDETVVPAAGAFRDGIRDFGVHLYRTR